MRKAGISILAAVVLGLLACNPFEKSITGVWFYAPAAERSKKDSFLTATSFLHLQSEGTYTSDLGFYDYGKWSQEGEELVLENNKGKTIRLRIKEFNDRELRLFANASTEATFDKYPEADNDVDPFKPENNQWRIRARQPESDAALKARLYNHCRFWETYFKWGLDHSINYLDVRSTPTPIRVYGNGFGLKKFDELPKAWQQYFYDTADCRKAHNILRDVFRKRNIKWPETEETYAKFISAFQQLQGQLK